MRKIILFYFWPLALMSGFFPAQNIITTNDYFFLSALIKTESEWNQNATNSCSGAIGYLQIVPAGALQYWNDFNVAQYTPADLYNYFIAKKIANFYLRQSFKIFDGCVVKTVNSYNMGMGNTRKNKFYFQFCTNILGYNMVSNWLEDYYVLRKTTNYKVWYLILKEDYDRER